MKKIICMLMAMVLLTVAFVGCSKKTSGDGIYEIVYYAWEYVTPDVEMVIDEVNKYIEPKIGARLKYIPIEASEYAQKMNMIFSSNDKFDICFISSALNFVEHAENGVFMPLDNLLKSVGRPTYDITPNYYFDAATVDGQIYAIPANKDVAQEWVFVFKKAMAERNNIDVDSLNVTCLEDLEPIFDTIRANEPNVYPVLVRGNNHFFKFLPFDPVVGSQVGAFETTGDFETVINQYATEEAKEFFQLMRRWYKKGFFRSDAATATNDSDIRATGNWFSCYNGYLPLYDDYSGQTVLPKTPSDPETKEISVHGFVKPHINTTNVMGSALAISSNSDNPEKAMEFINLLNTDPYVRNLIGIGIEGVHYEKVGETQYRLPDGVKSSTELNYKSYGYSQGNRFILKTRADIYPENIWDIMKEFNETAQVFPNLGFTFSSQNVRSEIAAINNVVAEYLPSLAVGAVEPDEYLPKFLKKLEDAGSKKVIAEIQKQYDEWKKIKSNS